MYKKILVGTDLSDTSKVAVEQAATLARRLGGQLTLLYAGQDPGPGLADLAAKYGAEAAVVAGAPADVLLDEAERRDVDLLVVGSVGMSGARRFATGNVPNKVSHHAHRDLLIVKTDRASTGGADYQKILIGTDGSPTAMRAVQAGCALAKGLGASLTILTAYEPPSEEELKKLKASGTAYDQWNASKMQKDTPDEFRWRLSSAAQAEDILDRAADRAAEAGVDAEVRAVEGPPLDVLCNSAADERFDLVCVGSVGLTSAKRFMLGNVPHRLTHHSPTNVLILRTT